MKREFNVVDGALVVSPSFEVQPLQLHENALELSIQKWETIVAALAAGQHVTSSGGQDTCALCQLPGGWREGCGGCPVSRAGWATCRNYEYLGWSYALVHKLDVDGLLEAAEAELNFLRGIRQRELMYGSDLIAAAKNKEIMTLGLSDDVLSLTFTDGTWLSIADDPPDSREHRYMHTEDVLSGFAGARLLNVEVRSAPAVQNNHEVRFLVVTTSLGAFTVETHNEHDGEYSGFLIRVRGGK